MNNNNTKYYILGILSGILFIPIIEDFLNVILAWFQVLLLKPNKIITKGNKELSEIVDDKEDYQETNCIGFTIPNTDDEDYDEEDIN